MSYPYRLTPGRLPVPPHPTPTSVSGYTLPNSKVGRAPIANPYDKFTQPEFDAWIGGITGALKRALGHDEVPPQAKQNLSETGDIPHFTPIDLPEDSDSDGADDSFAEIKARRAKGKGKARDPREGPGFSKTSVAQPIEIPSSDEEEEEEVEYSILHQNDSDVEEQAEDGEREAENDEYPWSTAESSQRIISSPPRAWRDEVDVGSDEDDKGEESEHDASDEEAEYEEYAEEWESEGEQQDQGGLEDEVIELISDDEKPSVPPTRSRPAVVEEVRYEEAEYDEEEGEEYDMEAPSDKYDVEGASEECNTEGASDEYDMEGAGEDEDEQHGQDDEDALNRQRFEHAVGDDEDVIEEAQPPEHCIQPIATTSTRRGTSVEIPDPWNGPRVYAQDSYSGGELQTSLERRDPSNLGPEDELDDGAIAQTPLDPEVVEEEFQHLDTAAAAGTTSSPYHDLPQHAGHPVFVHQAENDRHLGPSSMPPHHTRASASPFRELSFGKELVESAEENYIQPSSDEGTPFPLQTVERDSNLVQIPDPWDGPREYAQDFYTGGDIRPTSLAHMDADHLVPEDEDRTHESQARKEQEVEDDEIQPQDHDTAFLHDDVRAGAVEIRDPWDGPETYAQDYYSGGVNGALPADRIDSALLSVTGEIDDGYSSFLTPYTGTPSYPVDTEDEYTESDKFALPPAPEVYIPPSFRARDAPIPSDVEIFNVDDSDDEEAGNPVPLTEYTQDEHTIEGRGEVVDDELEYVDEDGMDVAEDVIHAPEGEGHATHDQSAELLTEQSQEREELSTLEESKEVLSSLLDWNNPPAFPTGLPASASGHLKTPSSEGEDLVAAEHPAAVESQAADAEAIIPQDSLPLTEKGQSPPLHDDAATSVQQFLEQEAASMSETDDLTAAALDDTATTSIDVREKLAEEPATVQEPDEQSTGSSVRDGGVAAGVEGLADSAIEDIGEDVLEIDQSVAATTDASDPILPVNRQDDDFESNVTDLEPIVEEVVSVAGSRPGTAPLPDLFLEELVHHAFVTDDKDTRPVIGIVEHRGATASPQGTPDRETLTVDVIDEHTEQAFVCSPPPISTLLHPTKSDLSFEDYASSVEVDELDEEEVERPNEDAPSVVVGVSAEQTDVEHRHTDEQPSSLVPGDVITTSNVEIRSDAPVDPTTADEVSESKLHQGALSPSTNDVAALQDSALPLSTGEHHIVDVADTSSAGNKPTAHHSARAELMNPATENNMVADGLQTDIATSEVSQATERSSPSRRHAPEIQSIPVDSPPSVLPKEVEADDVKRGDDLDRNMDASIAGSKTPTKGPSRSPIATPGDVPTNTNPETLFRSPERYTPSPPKADASEDSRASLAISDSAARDKPSAWNDGGGVIWTQEDLKDIAEAVSPEHIPQSQSMSHMNDASPTHRLPSPAHSSLESPSPAPRTFPDNQLEHLRNQYAATVNNPIAITIANAEPLSIPCLPREPNYQQSSSSQAPVLHAPAIIEQFQQQMPPASSASWPYSLSAPGTQQLTMSTLEMFTSSFSASPTIHKKPRATGTSSKSPKKGKKAAQLNKPHVGDPSSELQYPSDIDRKEALPHTISEVKPMTPQSETLKSKDVAQGVRLPADLSGNSQGLYGQQNLIKDDSLPPVTTLESASPIPMVEGTGLPKQELSAQKTKRTYKRKRDTSPGPGESQLGKADEKKTKKPAKRKSKLLELEGPIPGPSNGETIYVKAKPKGASPVEPSQTDVPTASRESIPKSKRGLLSVQSAPLPGSSAQTIRQEVLLVTRTGPPGISHRHGSDHSLTIPPGAPSFKALTHKTASPKKLSLPQTFKQTLPFAVVQSGASSTPEAPKLSSLPDTFMMPNTNIISSTNATQPVVEARGTDNIAPGTAPTVLEPSPANMQSLTALTTQTPTQLPGGIIASSDHQIPANITPVSTKAALLSDIPTVAPVTARALGTPSAPVARSMTASVGNTPTSQAGTPRTAMRATRSSCRYHRISLPKEAGGPRVRFLVPGCAVTNDILMKEQEIVDHGLAPVEDAYVMIKDIESLDLDSDLIGVLRVLVGHDIFRDQELFYLPSPGERLPVKPAFRKPTPSDKLESARLTTGSPNHSISAESPTFHKSSASVSGSTSSLSALRKAQGYEWSSNFGPTDSEGDSEDGDAHSKASYQGSDRKGKGKSRAKSGRKSKLGLDPDFVPSKEEQGKLSDAGGPESSTRKRRKSTGAKRGVKRTRTEAPFGEDPSRQNKKLKAHPTAPPSLASPEKPAQPDVPPAPNDS